MYLYSKSYLEGHKTSCFTIIEKMKLIQEAIKNKQFDEDTTEEKLKATFNDYFKELQRQKEIIERTLSDCEEYQTTGTPIKSNTNFKEIEQFKTESEKMTRTTKNFNANFYK